MGRRSIALSILVILLLAAGAMWSLNSRAVMAQVEDSLAAQLTSALGNEVTIERMEVSSFRQVTLYNAIIHDKNNDILANIPKITVTYNPIDLLMGSKAVNAISSITMAKPQLWLKQRSNGRWNVEDLLDNQDSSAGDFSGKVHVEGGQASVVAYGQQWQLEAIQGNVDFSRQPAADVKLTGAYKGKAVAVAGRINSKGRSSVDVTAQELPIKDWQVLCPAKDQIQLSGGSIKQLQITFVQDSANRQWAGQAELSGIAGTVQGVAVHSLTGYMTFAKEKVYLFAQAMIQEQPVKVKGSMEFGEGSPVLALRVSSDAFDTSVLRMPIQGMAAFNLSVSGMTDNPAVDGTVRLPKGNLEGYPVRQLTAAVHMADNKLEISHLAAKVLGGQITAAGTVAMKDYAYNITLNGRHIDVGALPRSSLPQVTGYGDMDIIVSGKGDLTNANIQGTGIIQQGEAAGVPFDSLAAGFVKRADCINVDYLNFSLGQGNVTAYGQINGETLQLNTYGNGIPLALLGRYMDGFTIDGIGSFSGAISGTTQFPQFSGQFTALNGQVYRQPFTKAQGTLNINKDRVASFALQLVNGPTTHDIQGSMGLTGSKELDVLVVSRNARAEDIINLLSPGERLTGNVNNEMHFTGPLADYQLEGHMVLTDGSFRGQLIAKGEGRYHREHGRLWLRNFVISSLNTQIRLSGKIEPDKAMDLEVTARDINLERLHLTFPYPVKGKAQFTGKLSGTPEFPIFSGQLSADKLLVNNHEFTGVGGQIKLQGQELEIVEFAFHQGDGVCTATGGFNMATNEIYGNLEVNNLELQSMLAVFNAPDKGIHGKLSGHIRVGGTVDKPDVWLEGSMKAGSIKKYPLDSIAIDVSLEKNVFTIHNFSAVQGNGVLVAKGTADLKGAVNMEVDGRDIDAGLISAWFDLPAPTIGQLQFAAQITGKTSKPHASISLEVDKGGIGNTTFDSLYGLFIADKENVHVDQILLTKGPYRASAYGDIPLAALNEQGQGGESMNLTIHLDEANLSILPLLRKEVSWASGQTQGEVTISGTLGKPVFNGSIIVKDGAIKLAALKDPLQKVNLDIELQGDTIKLVNFDGALGKGVYKLTGMAKISDKGIKDYHASLALDNLGVRSKYFTGPLNGNLELVSGGGKPKLSGAFQFAGDIINIPGIPELGTSSQDILLDVEIHAGKKVRFYNPMMYDITAAGHVRLAGTLKEPAVSGRIVAVRGTVNYLGTEFKVQEGRAEFTQYGSFEPVLHLEAQTKLQQTVVNLAIHGPVSTMQFTLSSEPSMSQQQILSLLTLRSQYFSDQASNDIGRDEVSGMLGAGLQARFVSEVEGSFRAALGLDEFKVVRDTSSDIVRKSSSEFATVNREVYNLEVGKYLTDKLTANYTMGLDYKKNEWALRYDLRRNFSLNASMDDQNNTWLGFETRFRF